jgi:hypothetical protein
MDDAAKTDCRTAQERLPFPLRCALCCAPSLHCKRASPAGRFLCHALQAAQPADPNYAQPSGFGETVAPQKWCGVKENRHALAFGKRAQKEKHDGRMCDVQAKRSTS